MAVAGVAPDEPERDQGIERPAQRLAPDAEVPGQGREAAALLPPELGEHRRRPAATQPLTTPFEFTGHMTISVNVSNFDAALDWYAKTLGFELIYRLENPGWGEVRTPVGDVSIGLSETEEVKHGGTVPVFSVADIEAARAHLEQTGTRFDGDTYEVEGMVKLATFYDPDGNAWMLAQSLQ